MKAMKLAALVAFLFAVVFTAGCEQKTVEELIAVKDSDVKFLGEGAYERVEYVSKVGTVVYFQDGRAILMQHEMTSICAKRGDYIEIWDVCNATSVPGYYYVRVVNSGAEAK